MIDLKERINTDTTHMALIFTARSVGYLLGSLVGGFLFDHFDKQLLLMVTLIVAALATSIIPWSLTLTVLTVMMSLQGMSMGVLDTGKISRLHNVLSHHDKETPVALISTYKILHNVCIVTDTVCFLRAWSYAVKYKRYNKVCKS